MDYAQLQKNTWITDYMITKKKLLDYELQDC